MRSIDTNVIVRYVMEDDEIQTPLAVRIFKEPCYVCDTVLLEVAWLLSSRYQLKRVALAGILSRIISLPMVTVVEPKRIAWAIERFAEGADFADMLHLIRAGAADSFATFDQAIARDAGPNPPVPVETLA